MKQHGNPIIEHTITDLTNGVGVDSWELSDWSIADYLDTMYAYLKDMTCGVRIHSASDHNVVLRYTLDDGRELEADIVHYHKR